jgi:hypothetical protein
MSFGIPVRNGLGIGLTPSTSISSGVRGTRPAMFLNFLNTTSLSGMVTFTRGSNATLVDSTGKITYAPANLQTFSEQFDNAIWSKGGVTVTANDTTAPDGTTTADKNIPDATLAFHRISQTNSVTNGLTYAFSVFVKASGYSKVGIREGNFSAAYAAFDISTGTKLDQGSGGVGNITAVGNGWYRIDMVSAATGTSMRPDIVVLNPTYTSGTITDSWTANGTSGIFIWGAQLEPVTYQTTPGTYNATTTAAYYGPRFDYDPVTLAAKGLLIEEARTNLLTGSADFTATYWPVATNAVVTANDTTSPDGTTNADKLADNTTAGVQHRLYRDYTFTAASHTLSVFAKRNDHRWLRLFFFDGTTSFFGNFDLLNGAVGNKQASTTTTITAFGNGWYRCTMTATTAAAAGNIQMVMLPSDDTAVPVLYTGTGTSLWLFGAQLEAGAFATSYIPTVASQVTRSADVATMTGTNFSSWYNQTEGTFVSGWDSIGYTANTMILAATDSGSTNLVQQFLTSSTSPRFIVRTSGVDQAVLDSTSGATTVNMMASAYKANDFASTVNGAAVVTDGAGTIPTVDRLGIGSRLASLFWNGHIRQIAYYNTRLPNATLQTLTEIPGAYSASYLAIAGGGSGGTDINGAGGGGGAGGYLASTATLFAGAVYTVTVGAGGPSGTSGSNSSIAGVATAVGGGAGGSDNIGSNGGSGGGGGGFGPSAGGSPTAGQGFKGGDSGDSYGAAGGGGAGEAGPNGSSTVPTRGGNGLASSITGTSVTRAGGGGAGNIFGAALPGGTGGGGAGASPGVNAVSGTANTGGGGGGKINAVAVGTGGSGVVILSVPTSKYTGTTTGSPTVTTSGTNTILTFTSSGSYTA